MADRHLHISGVAAIDPSAAGQPFQGRIRRRQWAQLSRGLYIPRASSLTDVLRGWELVLPKCAAFTSLTAAELRGWWLPEPIPHPVFVAVPVGERYPERKGLLVCRHPRPVPTVTFKGFRLTTGAETLLAAARDLGVLDLVILGDSALRCRDCTLDELRATAAQQRRGAPRLRFVLPLLDERSESPWESVMRVLHQAAGIHVEPQKELFDHWGRFIARADLWLVGTRRIHEYDGGKHRERRNHRNDLSRDRRLVEIECQRMGFTSAQLLHEGASIIASADRLLGRAWDPGRLARWEALLNDSAFRPEGRGRAQRHWARAL
jgi:hypothetical protein